MPKPSFTILEDRAVIAVTGEDRTEFLQGLVSNDVERAGPARAIYAAFLTAQGKYLHDFFITGYQDAFLLDCEAARRDDLVQRLSMYRLRSKVAIEPRSDLCVAAVFGEGAAGKLGLGKEPSSKERGAAAAFDGGVAFIDPRLAAASARALLPADSAAQTLENVGLAAAKPEDYDDMRLSLGLPDGSRDLIVGRSTLLESGFEELAGVDWDKGCFLGQELTARTRYRGLVKKRLVPVSIEGALPEPGTIIEQDGREAGEMRSGRGARGLALLRLDALERDSEPLTAGQARLTPKKPDWASF
ncbi:MAG: folate-binding protein [Alphaproteobacteria bacterium]|nr:folate-binding protein [Alphaproteobacteria bacterium]